jgi:hypothetical protein
MGLLSGMGQHVSLEICELGKSPGTNLAGIGFFSGMDSVMYLEMSGQDKRFRTLLTFMWFFS